MELYQAQVSAGSNRFPNPRTDAVAALIKERQQLRDRIARENYEDRGAGVYAGGYTAKEFQKMQEILLSDQHELVSSPLFTGHWLIYIYLQSFRTRLDILM